MADPDRAVEVRGTVAVHPAVAGDDPDALVAEIERTRENLARTIDTLAERVSPANAARKLRERGLEQAARPPGPLGAAAAWCCESGAAARSRRPPCASPGEAVRETLCLRRGRSRAAGDCVFLDQV